jgi:uncharacterized cupin superfamily protein
MEITVRKPTESEIAEMKSQPTWGCEVSEFDWYYENEETSLIIEGEVTVSYGDKSVAIVAGDLVVFPRGLSCVWKVTQPLRKHYLFR